MDNYEQLGDEPLGTGCFGEVHLIERKSDKARFVIKRIDVTKLPPHHLARTQREIDILGGVSHPNIVKYEESFKDGKCLCIVMEHCEGGDLENKLLGGGNISENQMWDWFVQIAVALKYLHGRRIIHRDLKPSNIFIHNDVIRIGDFGVSREFEQTTSMTQGFYSVGDLSYRSPEMMEEDVRYCNKTDVWSLGCILYYIAMRRSPFQAGSPLRIATLIAACNYPAIPTTFSKELRETVATLLTIDRGERPTISQVLAIQHIKERVAPDQRLRTVYGYSVNGGIVQDQQGNGFKWDNYVNKRDNNLRFEGVAEILEEHIYLEMEKLGLKRLPVPMRAVVDPDYDSAGSFIFATDDWMGCERLLILIHGSGSVKAGMWTRRHMINDSVIEGSQLPYIKRAIECEYGVIVLNTNDRRPGIEGCLSAEDHGEYVWANYVKETSATQIAVKAHSDGGSVTEALLKKFEDDFKTRVYANAFTGVGCLMGQTVQEYTRKVTRNWITSDKPLGTVLPSNGCECVSAGTGEHIETPIKAFSDVFKFIAERFRDQSPGNL